MRGHEHLSGLEGLAQFSGLPVSKVDRREVDDLYTMLSADIPLPFRLLLAHGSGLLEKYILPESLQPPKHTKKPVDFTRILNERRARFNHYAETILHTEPVDISYGLYAPSYHKALLEYRKQSQSTHSHKSLLIGALSLNTVHEYETTVRRVFPDAQTAVIDLEGVETKQGANFTFANALSIPFASNSFDVVHTNSILHQLEGESSERLNRTHLLGEAHRILKPGGMLLMVESNLPWTYNMEPKIVPRQVELDFLLAGLPKPTIHLATQFKSREAMFAWLRDPNKKQFFTKQKDGQTFEIILRK